MKLISFMSIVLTFLLTACGGGSSSSGGESPPDKNDTNTPNSSNYNTEQLKVYFNISGINDSDAKVTAYVQDTDLNYVALSEMDNLLVIADGVSQNLESKNNVNSHGGEYYSVEVSALSSEYIVRWQRDGVDVDSIRTENNLPLPFRPIASLAGEVIDVSWALEADHRYYYLGEVLKCQSDSEMNITSVAPDYSAGEGNLDNGHYSRSLFAIFGKPQSELIEGYDSCQFEMNIIGTKNDALPLITDYLTLDVDQSRTIKLNL